MAGWWGLEKMLQKVEVPLISIAQNINLDFSEAQAHRAEIFIRMEENRVRGNKIMKIDKQIEIVKLIQRIFDNCSEGEVHVGGDVFTSKLELEDICRAIERTLEDLVNEKLRDGN